MSKMRPERLHHLLMDMKAKCRKTRITSRESNPRFYTLSQYALLAYLPQITFNLFYGNDLMLLQSFSHI